MASQTMSIVIPFALMSTKQHYSQAKSPTSHEPNPLEINIQNSPAMQLSE